MLKNQENTILITVDSLRADHLACYGYPRATSPNLDNLAKESYLFSHAFSSGPNTPHAFPAIMASRSSLQSPKLGLFDVPLTLAEALKSAGYVTVGFNASNPYVSKYFHYDRGFDEFHDYLIFPAPTQESQSKSNHDLTTQKSAIADEGQSSMITIPELELNHYVISEENIHRKACLENQINSEIYESIKRIAKEPFFLWIHYMDTHYPYLPQLDSQFQLGVESISKEDNFQINTRVRENMGLSSDMLSKAVDLYDSAIRQVDAKIGELFAFLKQLGLYDSTNIILTADHGEEFLEHGDLQHKSKLFDELLHVPLFIKLADQRAGEVRNELTSLIQLAPTIISELQLENQFTHKSIFDRLDIDSGEYSSNVFAEACYGKNGVIPAEQHMLKVDRLPKLYCCQNKHWKLIMDQGNKQNHLFNMVTDAAESINVYDQESTKFSGMQKELEQHIATLDKTRLTTQISRIRTKMSNTRKENHALCSSC